MLSIEENELITRTGPGTPMGEVLRRYWVPALLSWELPEPDCPPVRLRLMSEDLVAFRDTAGRVGILDEFCPHRLASLWLGRNEEHGLRCIYHGWKFDVDGNCVEQMNEPESFGHKVHIKHYPAVERGGVIWTYMGPPEQQPPPPDFEWTRAPESHRHVSKGVEECNWMQALEGGLDTSHVPVLHRILTSEDRLGGVNASTPMVQGGAPVLEVEETGYGYRYFGIRILPGGRQYVRGYHYVMPWTQIRPQQIFRASEANMTPYIAGHMWVPIDDQSCMVWNWVYSYGEEPLSDDERLEIGTGNGRDAIDFENGFRAYRNRANNWLIDRRAQKTKNFSGIDGINAQDRAVQESMGPIVDRSREHLGPADRAIIVARQLLLRAVRAVQDGGMPPGAAGFQHVRAIEQIVPGGRSWRESLLPEMDKPDMDKVEVTA